MLSIPPNLTWCNVAKPRRKSAKHKDPQFIYNSDDGHLDQLYCASEKCDYCKMKGANGSTSDKYTTSTDTLSSTNDKESRTFTYKVLLIGDAYVGKTSFVHRYAYDRMMMGDYKMTIGVDFALKEVKWSDNITIKLQLWDIAGQERFASMTRVYYKDAHACIIMFDLGRRQTFTNAVKWKKDLDSKCLLPSGHLVPCILLANKCDLPFREIEQSEIEECCKEHNFIGWTEVSVKKNEMVEESMKFLLREVMLTYNNELYTSDDNLSTIDLSKDTPPTEKCSC